MMWWNRGVRTAFAVAVISLVAGPRQADACSPWFDGYVRTVLPEAGATSVPLNARITVDYSWIIDPVGLELREAGGASVSVTLDRLPARLVVSPTAYLAPNTTYELLDTLSLECVDPEPWCYGEAAVIATFTTGSDEDLVPPQISGVSVTGEFRCNEGSSCDTSNYELTSVAITAVEDDGPDAWLRYEYLDEDGSLVYGPGPLIQVVDDCSGGGPDERPDRAFEYSGTFQLRAVDLAGNVSAAHTLATLACPLANEDGCGDDPVPELPEGGCSTHRGAAPWLGLVALLLRRRRCARTSAAPSASRTAR